MRNYLAIIVVSLLPMFVYAADAADTPETRGEAAARYLKAIDAGKLIADMAEVQSKNMPPEQQEQFKSLMTKHVRTDVLQAGMVIVMKKHFTTRELNALADFYGSEEGRSTMAKFGVYMADVMPLIQAEMARAAAELQQQSQSQFKPTDA